MSRFRSVFATSEDPGGPLSELNEHKSDSKGWSSAKFCTYPQELGFELLTDTAAANNSKAKGKPPATSTRLGIQVSKIEFLSHQFKIGSKVEVFLGTTTNPDGSTCAYEDAHFERLGYLSLDKNEKSGHQARELKSVHVDNRDCMFVRFLIHKNHVNIHNHCNQVAVIAVNFHGSIVEKAQTAQQPSVANRLFGDIPQSSSAAAAGMLPGGENIRGYDDYRGDNDINEIDDDDDYPHNAKNPSTTNLKADSKSSGKTPANNVGHKQSSSADAFSDRLSSFNAQLKQSRMSPSPPNVNLAVATQPINKALGSLATEVNIDPYAADILNQLLAIKGKAIKEENYQLAKVSKNLENEVKMLGKCTMINRFYGSVGSLCDVGVRLQYLQNEKIAAVDDEDFDRAKELKEDIDLVRVQLDEMVTSVGIRSKQRPRNSGDDESAKEDLNQQAIKNNMSTPRAMLLQQQQEYEAHTPSPRRDNLEINLGSGNDSTPGSGRKSVGNLGPKAVRKVGNVNKAVRGMKNSQPPKQQQSQQRPPYDIEEEHYDYADEEMDALAALSVSKQPASRQAAGTVNTLPKNQVVSRQHVDHYEDDGDVNEYNGNYADEEVKGQQNIYMELGGVPNIENLPSPDPLSDRQRYCTETVLLLCFCRILIKSRRLQG
jgi:hypothetical protein